MQKSLLLAFQALNEGSVLASHIQYNRQSGTASQVIRDVDTLRNEVGGRLELLADYLDLKAVAPRDMPRSLEAAATKLASRANQINQTNDWDGLHSALVSLSTVLDSVDTVLAKKALVSVRKEARSSLEAGRKIQRAAKAIDKREEQADRAFESIGNARSDSKAALRETIDAKTRAKEQSREAIKAAGEAANAARLAKQHWDTAKAKAGEVREAATDAARAEREAEKVQARLVTMEAREKTRLKNIEVLLQAKLKSLRDSDESAKEILFGATVAGLAQYWQRRRVIAQNMMWGLGVLMLLLTASAVVSVVIILSPDAAKALINVKLAGTWSEQVLAKLIIAPPFVFAIWFCASQFSHVRRQAEEYGAKETVAMTLEPYRKFLSEFAGPDETRKAKAFEVVTSAIEALYARTLTDNSQKDDSLISFSKKNGIPLENLLNMVEKIVKITDRTPKGE